MQQILQRKRGIAIVELFLYVLAASIILAFFILFLWRTRQVHEQQTLELSYQGSFAKLCDQLEKDLTGCRDWKISGIVGPSNSLIVDRVEAQIIYDVRIDSGEIVRNMRGNLSIFPFRGEKEGLLKTLEFIRHQANSNTLNLTIELKTTPPIELTHNFFIRLSVHKNPGYFEEPDLGKKAAGYIKH